jgi:hypothetical protein
MVLGDAYRVIIREDVIADNRSASMVLRMIRDSKPGMRGIWIENSENSNLSLKGFTALMIQTLMNILIPVANEFKESPTAMKAPSRVTG